MTGGIFVKLGTDVTPLMPTLKSYVFILLKYVRWKVAKAIIHDILRMREVIFRDDVIMFDDSSVLDDVCTEFWVNITSEF
jgi:hypothetical protein